MIPQILQKMAPHELFRLARPQVDANGHGPETDLFAGITGSKPRNSLRSIF